MTKTAKKYISPVKLMLAIWGIEIYMYNLHIVSFYNPLNFLTFVLVFGVILALICSKFFVLYRNKKLRLQGKQYTPISLTLEEIEDKSKFVLKLFLIGTVINVVFSGGFPLLWLVIGDARTYQDFGVHGFNGMVNSFYYISLLCYTYLYLKKRGKKQLIILLGLIFYPVFSMARALIFTGLFEVLGLYLLLNRIRLKSIIIALLLAISIIVAFGQMGDNRNGLDSATESFVRSYVDDEYVDLMEKLPSGFTWVYIYFTCAINNITYNINTLQPTGYPYFTVRRLLPSFIAERVIEQKDYEDKYALKMDDSVFNVFTIYSNYIKDFGVFFTIILFFLVGIFFYDIYYKSSPDDTKYLFMYPPIFMILCLSVFDDFLLSLPTLFQFVFTSYFFRRRSPRRIVNQDNN